MWYTKPANFESIANHRNISKMLHVPKNNNGKDAGTICQLVCGKTHLTIFTSRRSIQYANYGNVKAESIYLRETRS